MLMIESIKQFGENRFDDELIDNFVEHLYYQPINTSDSKDYILIKDKLSNIYSSSYEDVIKLAGDFRKILLKNKLKEEI